MCLESRTKRSFGDTRAWVNGSAALTNRRRTTRDFNRRTTSALLKKLIVVRRLIDARVSSKLRFDPRL
jgi:hypothetical protein